MSSHNRKSIISSRHGRPRAFSTLTPHLTEAHGITADRISRTRSRSTQSNLLSERHQQAILDAVASSQAFHTPQYQPSPSPRGSFTGSSIDPRSLSLAPSESLPTPVANLSVLPIDHPSGTLIHGGPEGEKAFVAGALEGQNMSATAYMLPSYGHMDPYNSGHYQSSYQSGGAYIAEESHNASHASTPVTTYATSYTTSPALMSTSPRVPQGQERSEGRTHRGGSYPGAYHSTAPSPYLPAGSPAQQAYGFANSSPHVAQFASQSPGVANHDLASGTYGSTYSIQHPTYPAGTYESGYHSAAAPSPGYGAPQTGASYITSQGYAVSASADAATSSAEDSGVRILNARPKPQCWDHGCNGRQFSTFSNLLRHQREKSGTAAKSVCPRCGAEFTRTTARNGHMAHDKCKRKSTTSTSGAE
ncbi:hypothetical protein NA57DRAFT_78387 [Rhizodiscina lignyota]|uniref:C2H2-type domain-containing protein n=1 Tax=Rhizodiscina lignyota TaxID=1504668 RepID=A0A9P4I9Y9_9PEZI|nr:hypothetical protein NA57DRAFT_78387 [Rhizodiscina lignyota]